LKERVIVASDLQRSGYTQPSEPSRVADCNGVTGCLKGDHQYVALRCQEVVRKANSPLITKEKEEKMGQINTMKTNSKRRKDLRLVTWNVRTLHRPGDLRITIDELRKYKIAIAAIQETRWNKLTP
jgi:hypothetical protein